LLLIWSAGAHGSRQAAAGYGSVPAVQQRIGSNAFIAMKDIIPRIVARAYPAAGKRAGKQQRGGRRLKASRFAQIIPGLGHIGITVRKRIIDPNARRSRAASYTSPPSRVSE
jgi:hypothetical protein